VITTESHLSDTGADRSKKTKRVRTLWPAKPPVATKGT
jgi:hypothetical protein